MEALVRSSPTNQVITGSVKDLSVISCIYAPEKRSSTKSQVHWCHHAFFAYWN